jgi:phosphoglycerate kinase
VAARVKGKAFGITGGGETIEVLKKLHLIGDVDLASTGGGSMLEYLSGKKLPGIEALMKK